MTTRPYSLAGLLEADEPPPFSVINPAGSSKLVLVCDHASNQMPRSLSRLNMSDADLASHIAWDPGAALVAIGLSARLDAVLVMSGYSRLVIDCNRPLESPELIPMQSAGIPVPGNLALTPNQTEQRIQSLFMPYHHAIADILNSRMPLTTHLLSVHSFTPCLQGQQRPWHIGVAEFRNDAFTRKLYEVLQESGDRLVGFNKPYAIETEFDYTIPHHGETFGLFSAMVEIRQDTLRSESDVAFWVNRLATAVQQSL